MKGTYSEVVSLCKHEGMVSQQEYTCTGTPLLQNNMPGTCAYMATVLSVTVSYLDTKLIKGRLCPVQQECNYATWLQSYIIIFNL